ncbi:hypothetical protein IKB17_05790 [bacterium]|nr:hypothetical protein [bacterium]
MKINSQNYLLNSNMKLKKTENNLPYSSNIINSYMTKDSFISFQGLSSQVVKNRPKNLLLALVAAASLAVAPKASQAQQANTQQPQTEQVVYKPAKSFKVNVFNNELKDKGLAHQVVDMEITTVRLKNAAIESVPDSINNKLAILGENVKLADSTNILDDFTQAIKNDKYRNYHYQAFRDIHSSQLDSTQTASLIQSLDSLKTLPLTGLIEDILPDNLNNSINDIDDIQERKVAIDTLLARINNKNKAINEQIKIDNKSVSTNNAYLSEIIARKDEIEKNEQYRAEQNWTDSDSDYESPLDGLKEEIANVKRANMNAIIKIAQNKLLKDNLEILRKNIAPHGKYLETVMNDVNNMNEFLDKAGKKEEKLIKQERAYLEDLVDEYNSALSGSGTKGNKFKSKFASHTSEATEKGTVRKSLDTKVKVKNKKTKEQNKKLKEAGQKRKNQEDVVKLYDEKKADLNGLIGNSSED